MFQEQMVLNGKIPFSVKKYGRDKCLELYKEYIENNQELKSQLPELKNKVLGCWCHPEKCHGDILLELVNQLQQF